MTGIRWSTALDADHRMVHRMEEQSDYDGTWRLVAEVIPGTLPWMLVVMDDQGNEIATATTLSAAREAAESYLDNRNEDAWQARQEDIDVVTLREQAWADHQDAEILHDRGVA